MSVCYFILKEVKCSAAFLLYIRTEPWHISDFISDNFLFTDMNDSKIHLKRLSCLLTEHHCLLMVESQNTALCSKQGVVSSLTISLFLSVRCLLMPLNINIIYNNYEV